jgi:hypothetical protein
MHNNSIDSLKRFDKERKSGIFNAICTYDHQGAQYLIANWKISLRGQYVTQERRARKSEIQPYAKSALKPRSGLPC